VQESEELEDVPIRELSRDLIAFEVKLVVDGLKDVVLAPLALLAFGAEVLLRAGRRGRVFYGLMKLGIRFDRWLGLFEPVRDRTPAEGAPRFSRANDAILETDRRIFTRKARDADRDAD
jgi:hypothetical protein